MGSTSVYKDNVDKTFSVNLFFGEDGSFRFVPGVRNHLNIYVPVAEGVEIPHTTDPVKIGEGYIATAINSLNHYGEDLDIREAPPKYKSFKKFTSQKKFNLSHCLIGSKAINGEIKFTYFIWHKNEFCLLRGDPIIEKVISQDSNSIEIGNAILTVLEEARIAFPNNKILNNDK